MNITPPTGTNVTRLTPGATNSTRSTLAAFPTLWLNEVLPTNFFLGTNGIVDRIGERDPWVELYNGGTSSLSLSGYYLANNYTNLGQWAFPTNAAIAPKGFLLVWLDGQTNQASTNEFHANFRAAPSLGSVVLSRGSNASSIIDYFNYDVPTPGRSYASFPDGAVSGRRLFGTTTPGATNNPAYPPVTVWINEWMADNKTTLTDPADNDYEDWFELFNPGTNAVDLSGYYLSDTLTNTTQWAIPDGTIIPARGYLLVWADGETGQNSPSRADLHANFSLAKGGEAIGLFAPDGTLIDGVAFGAQTSDVSQGRFPDGASSIFFMTNATPRTTNVLPGSNTPPTLALIGGKSINEGALLSFTAVATDTNVPAQTLTFSLGAGAPDGASIHPTSGLFTWIPTEAQGPGTYPVAIRVTDSGLPNMSATQTVTIVVNEVNSAPSLATILSQTVSEGSLLLVTNSATDSDAGPQTLTFSLDPGAPTNMTINPATGLIQWTPTEAQGPGSYSVTVRVTDDGDPPLSDARSFAIWVNEENVPPQFTFATNFTVNAGSLLTFTATATDSDLPAQPLSYRLETGAPAGAAIDPGTGVFTWTPMLAQGPSTNIITASVSDPFATTSRSFTVRVNDKQPPTLTFWTNAVLNADTNCHALMPDLTSTNYFLVTDLSGPVTVTQSVATNTVLALGTNWIVIGAWDAVSNVAYLTNFVLVLDVTPPSLACPGNLSVNTDAGRNSRSNVTFSTTASDNCGTPTVLCVPPSGSTFFPGTNDVTCTAIDVGGNSNQCVFTVTVCGVENPQIHCPANTNFTANAGQNSRSNVAFSVTASDNVALASVVCVPPSNSTFTVGSHLVACTATDTSGNTAQCSFTVTITDTENPQITCPTNLIFSTDAGRPTRSNVTFTATANDNVTVTNLACVPPSGSTFVLGTNSVTCTARDSSGNSAQCGFTVTIRDTEPPQLLCPVGLVFTKDAGQSSKSNVTFTASTSDNVTVTNLACIPPSGSTFPFGTNLVSCTARDSSGNSATCAFNVVVTTLLTATVTDSVNLRIPDGSPLGLVSSVDVSTPMERVTDVNVSLVVTGGFNGDLQAYLVHDSGHAILLNRAGKTLANPSGYSDAGYNVTFDDSATNGDIHTYRLALSGNPNTPLPGVLTGAWLPDARDTDPALVLNTDPRSAFLSAFNGLNPNGRWTLFIADVDALYVSTLVSWGLQILGTNAPPVLTAPPQSQTNIVSTTATLNVTATGLSALTYQWYFGLAPIPGATNASLSLANVQTTNTGDYQVAVTSLGGTVLSPPATLTVIDQTMNGLVEMEYFAGPARNGTGSRYVTLRGTDAMNVRLATWILPLNFTNGTASFTLAHAPLGLAHLSAKTVWHLRTRLPVYFANGVASVNFTSANALRSGDLDGSNTVNLGDYFILAGAWSTPDPAADLDGNGWVDVDDYFLLSHHWQQTGDPE